MTSKEYAEKIKKQIREDASASELSKSQIYAGLKNLLGTSNGNGGTFYDSFMKKFLNQALKAPNSKAGQMLASTIMQENLLQMLDEQHEKEMSADLDFKRYRIIKTLFKEQRDMVLETNHAKRIIACCSRRAGKTDGSTAAIDYASIVPNSRVIYINLTFTNAINQIWAKVLERSEGAGLSITSSSKSSGSIEWSNGSSLRIMGNPNNSEIEKLRGESQVSLIVIDEFFHQKNMAYALNEVISPLLADRSDSSILCIGTPPRIPHTDGEKIWNERGWKKFHWTMFDNPYIPDPEGYLADYCEHKGITRDAPFIQREYYGIIGAYDLEALVFKGRTTYKALGQFKPTDIAIGVDYGFSDNTAIVTIAYNKQTKEQRIVSEEAFNRVGVSTIIDRVIEHHKSACELLKKSGVHEDGHVSIYADTNEEAITYDLVNKYKLPAFNCYKYDKTYAIELLADELRSGRMRIPAGGVLDTEMEQILYRRDKETDAIIPELDEEEGIHPNAMFALLYASRKVFFDLDYDVKFKESKPKTSDYIKDKTGTIIGVDEDSHSDFEDTGVVG